MNRTNLQVLENLISKVVKKTIREELSSLRSEINSLKEDLLSESTSQTQFTLKESTQSIDADQQRLALRNKYERQINYTGNEVLNGLLNETSPLEEGEVNSILDTPQSNGLDNILNRDYSQLMKAMNITE